MFVAVSQVLVLPIIARYLDVAEFGDVALAMTVTLFAQLLSDAGLGRSLIRKSPFDPAEWSSVFWFLVVVGTLLATTLILIAPGWAWLFDRPSVAPLVMALSVVPFLFSLSAVPTALMERGKRFPLIATIRAAAAIAGFVTVVLLALGGAGAWALIGQQVAIAAVQCGGALLLSGFRPMSPLKRVPLGDHLGFARNTLGVSFLMTAQRQFPMMMIGYVLGAATLGYYSMSQRILNLPLNSVGAPFARIAFVQMSAIQTDAARIRDLYLHGILLLSFAILPPMALLAGVADTAFVLLLSEAWRPAAAIFALAATGIALDTTTSHAGVLFQAVNRTGLRLRMVAERTLLRVALIAAALPFGVEAAAASITLSALIFLPRLLGHLGKAIPFEARAVYATLLRPVAMALFVFAGGCLLQSVTSGWTTLGLALLFLTSVWLAGAWLMRRSLRAAVAAFTR